jgi:hypothetical protein
VVADQDVQQVGVATQMRVGESNQLTLTNRGGQRHRPVEAAAIPGDQGGRDQERGRVGGRSKGHDLVDGARVAADETV